MDPEDKDGISLHGGNLPLPLLAAHPSPLSTGWSQLMTARNPRRAVRLRPDLVVARPSGDVVTGSGAGQRLWWIGLGVLSIGSAGSSMGFFYVIN